MEHFSIAERLEKTHFGQPLAGYKFERIKALKLEALKSWGAEALLDFGIGEPQGAPDARVIEALREAAQDPNVHGYTGRGSPVFLKSVAAYMEKRFGVKLDPGTQILHSIGSKAALALLPSLFINPGNVALVTDPGYPIFSIHTQYCGGTPYPLALREENGFLPELLKIPSEVLKKAKVLLLNYPNNPTGAMAPDSFFEEAIAFCKKWGLVLIHDCAYVDLDWGPRRARSILEFPGAIDCAVELHSLSKAFNMTGWRLGWVCGNAKLVSAYGHVKDQSDSGQFLPIQYAGARALELPEITQKAREQYQRRMEALIGVLTPAGFRIKRPDAGFFLYLAAPKAAQCQGKSYAFESGQAFSQWLLLEHGIVTVPWDEVDACVRFSVTFKAPTPEAEAAVWQKLKNRLAGCIFSF